MVFYVCRERDHDLWAIQEVRFVFRTPFERKCLYSYTEPGRGQPSWRPIPPSRPIPLGQTHALLLGGYYGGSSDTGSPF